MSAGVALALRGRISLRRAIPMPLSHSDAGILAVFRASPGILALHPGNAMADVAQRAGATHTAILSRVATE